MIASPMQSPGFFGFRAGPPETLRRRTESPRNAEAVAVAGWHAGSKVAERLAVSAPVAEAATAVSLEQMLVQRITYGVTLTEMERVRQLGYQGYLLEQLNPEAIDDGGLEKALAEALPTLKMTPSELYYGFPVDIFPPLAELSFAAMYRAIYSPRQLYERMVEIWSDHFSIDLYGDTGYFLKLPDDRGVIRRHALSTFPDLLQASAHSPAMLAYLTNDTNVQGHPNENYARELMELHTLGVDNGYTQEDVREVARCFTGWTYAGEEDPPNLGRFKFDPDAHDNGPKRVLGHAIPAGGGVADGETVLRILAQHPNTSRFIARKLLRAFWGYEPPQGYVAQVALVYQRTGGDVRAMLRSILKPRWMAEATPKLKRPFHLMAAALRATFAGAQDPYYLYDQLQQAGHLPFAWSPPNGYPDARPYWSGFLLPRWNFTATVMDPAVSGVAVDLSYLSPGLTPQALANLINAVLANGTLSEATVTALRSFLRAAPRTPERIREAVGLALASPELQDY